MATKSCSKCGQVFEATTEFFYASKRSKDGLKPSCKNCARAYAQAHLDLQRVRSRRWDVSHPEFRAAYRAAHRDESALYMIAYYEANRDKCIARTAAWVKAHPERVRVNTHARRARILGNGGTHTSSDIRTQHDRQRGGCFYCGDKVGADYHVDHVMPLAKGGSNGPENLVIACPACNRSKHDRHPMDFCGRLL